MKIAIYSRKSKFTGKGESIENQIELCRQYIRLHSQNVSERDLLIYEDEGFSGGNTDRPQFQKMMRDARAKQFGALICYRLDRISRNIGDFARLIEELHSLSISFVSIREQFDTDSPMGRAMMYIASVFSQLERETAAERIRDNMRELAKTGRWLGGTTPTGYRSGPVQRISPDGKARRAFRLILQPDEAETVTLIYRKFLEAQSLTKVETFLIQNGILSKTGKRYTRFTIRNILENPVYMKADPDAYRYFADSGAELCAAERDFDGSRGIMAYNKTVQLRGRATRTREISSWIVAIGKHPGLLPGEDWVRVQKILSQNRSKSYRRPKSSAALLSGLLRCGNCGSYMRPKLTRRKNAGGELIYTYLCELKEKSHGQNCAMKNINGNLLDREVCSKVEALPENHSIFLGRLRSGQGRLSSGREMREAKRERLSKSVRKNQKAIEGLVSALVVARGSSAAGYLTGRINRLHEENTRFQSQLEEMEAQSKAQFLTGGQMESAKNILLPFSSVFALMTAEEKRNALRLLVDRVVWDGETAQVYLFGSGKGPPSPSKNPQREDSK